MSGTRTGIESALTNTFTSEHAITEFESKHGVSLCEIVHQDEIYSVSRNPDYDPANIKSPAFLKDRRICGRLRTKQGPKYRCLMPAGHGTNHVHYGPCRYHEGRKFLGGNRFSRMLAAMKVKGLALDFIELEYVKQELFASDEGLVDINYEIQILEMVLMKATSSDVFDPGVILEVVNGLVKAKAAKSKIETEKLTLDVASVKLFVRTIFEILKSNLGRPQYSKVMQEVIDKLALPMNKPLQKLLSAEYVEVEVVEK